MVRTHPGELPDSLRTDPRRAAEDMLFDCLQAGLPGDYRVYYSVRWLARGRRGEAPRDGEIDFVVAHPEKGLLLIEVKGGRIAYRPQDGRWTSTDRDGVTHEIDDPIEQLLVNRHGFLDRLHALPELAGVWLPVGYAVAFPHCDFSHDLLRRPDLDRAIVLFEADFDRIAAWVEGAYAFWAGGEQRPRGLDPRRLRALDDALAGPVELRVPLAGALRDGESRIERATAEQCRVLDMMRGNRRVAVRGGAGTGKTVLALEQARRLAAEGHAVLLTCFNRALADWLQRAAAAASPAPDVMSFHELCRRFVEASGALPSWPTDPDQAFWDQRLPELLLAALDRLPERRYDAIVVDEGQDFRDTWWAPLLLTLRDPDHGILWVFHDDNQALFRRADALPGGLVPVALTRNLRNSRAIHAAVSRHYRGGAYEPEGPDGPEVAFHPIAGPGQLPRELGRVLHHLVIDEKLKLADVAVLTGRSLSPGAPARTALRPEVKAGQFRLRLGWPDEEGAVLVESVRRFKGLERSAIVLVELEDRLADPAVLYVALSRARQLLVVIGEEGVATALGQTASPAPPCSTSR